MTLRLSQAIRLWWQQHRSKWCRPRIGWLLWILWSRQVEVFGEPCCDGSVNDAGPLDESQPTVVARRLL